MAIDRHASYSRVQLSYTFSLSDGLRILLYGLAADRYTFCPWGAKDLTTQLSDRSL